MLYKKKPEKRARTILSRSQENCTCRGSAGVDRPQMARSRLTGTGSTAYNEGTQTVPGWSRDHTGLSLVPPLYSEKKQKPHQNFPSPTSSSLFFPSPFLFFPLQFSPFSHTSSQWVLLQTASPVLSFSPPSRLVRVTPIRLRELFPSSPSLLLSECSYMGALPSILLTTY